MDTIKGRVHAINMFAQAGLIQDAQWDLDMLNMVYGTNLKLLNGRVVYTKGRIDDDDEFYANCHDAEDYINSL